MCTLSVRWVTACAIAVVVFVGAGARGAVVVTSAGTTTDADTIPPPGSAGYVFYAVDNNSATDLFTGTATRPVSYATITTDVNDNRFAGGANYSALTVNGTVHSTGVLDKGSSIVGTQFVMGTITLTNANGTTTGGAAVSAFQIGFLEDNSNNPQNNTPIQLTAPGALAIGTPRAGVMQKNDFLLFDVTDGTVGDVITITGTSTGNAACIGGITFDAVPEPATLSLLAIGAAAFLGGRNRRANRI